MKKQPKNAMQTLFTYLMGKMQRIGQKSVHEFGFKQFKKAIRQDPLNIFSTFGKYFAWKKHKFEGKLESMAIKFIRSYYKKRVRLGKVDIPYIEVVLTTKCTLKCESCNNLMQYFNPKNQYTCTLQGITHSLDKLFSAIDSVQSMRIIGGEPLLFKDIDRVITYLGKQEKLRSFNVVTNGTLLLKQESLDALKACNNAMVYISDYSTSPNLKIPLKQDLLINQLKTHSIPYCILWTDKDSAWFNPGKIYKRNRTKDDIVRNFKACMMPCVSLMSNEGIRRGEKDSAYSSKLESKIAPSGALFICPIASSLSRLRGLGEFSGDFVDLSSQNLGRRIIEFYRQDFFWACDYCHDMWCKKERIPIAIQADKTLRIKSD